MQKLWGCHHRMVLPCLNQVQHCCLFQQWLHFFISTQCISHNFPQISYKFLYHQSSDLFLSCFCWAIAPSNSNDVIALQNRLKQNKSTTYALFLCQDNVAVWKDPHAPTSFSNVFGHAGFTLGTPDFPTFHRKVWRGLLEVSSLETLYLFQSWKFGGGSRAHGMNTPPLVPCLRTWKGLLFICTVCIWSSSQFCICKHLIFSAKNIETS